MTVQILEKIEREKMRTREVNRFAIEKRVPTIQKNYSEIAELRRKPIFFYRQAGMTEDSLDRKNFYQQFLELWLSVSFAERLRGEFYVNHFLSVVEWRNSVDAANPLRRQRSFWEIEEETETLNAKRRTAIICGNFSEARRLTAQIRRCEKEKDGVLDLMSGGSSAAAPSRIISTF